MNNREAAKIVLLPRRFDEYRNKWLKYVLVSAAKLFFDALNVTVHLLLLFESESILVYQVKNAVEETA